MARPLHCVIVEMLLRLRPLALIATAISCFVICASTACDPFPDECELDDNVCDGNVANVCEQPGPEARLRTTRDDCGPTRACVLQSRFGYPHPVCARTASPECPSEGALSCADATTRAECIRTTDGRLVWLDNECPTGYACTEGACRLRQ